MTSWQTPSLKLSSSHSWQGLAEMEQRISIIINRPKKIRYWSSWWWCRTSRTTGTLLRYKMPCKAIRLKTPMSDRACKTNLQLPMSNLSISLSAAIAIITPGFSRFKSILKELLGIRRLIDATSLSMPKIHSSKRSPSRIATSCNMVAPTRLQTDIRLNPFMGQTATSTVWIIPKWISTRSLLSNQINLRTRQICPTWLPWGQGLLERLVPREHQPSLVCPSRLM